MTAGPDDFPSASATVSPADKGQPAAGMAQAARMSRTRRARIIWVAVAITVLTALGIETSNSRTRSYNFFLSGDSAAIGASVSIDGQPVGNMAGAGTSGLGGAVFYAHVADGHHVVEVSKPGFAPYRHELDMHTQEYVRVQLAKATN